MHIRLRYKIIVTVSIVFVILSGPGCNHQVQYERQQTAIAKVKKLDVGHSNFSDKSHNTENRGQRTDGRLTRRNRVYPHSEALQHHFEYPG